MSRRRSVDQRRRNLCEERALFEGELKLEQDKNGSQHVEEREEAVVHGWTEELFQQQHDDNDDSTRRRRSGTFVSTRGENTAKGGNSPEERDQSSLTASSSNSNKKRDATTTINNNNAKNNIAPLEELYDKNRPLFLFRDVPASERQSLFK